MEKIYQSYTKTIDNTTYFFVKKFMVFPELKDVQPVLESFGMHTNFDKACEIAGIQDLAIKQRLVEEIQGNMNQAKVIDLKDAKFNGQKAANQ